MIAFILIVGLMNIAVGFVFAMLLVPPAPVAAAHALPTEHAAEKKSRFRLPSLAAIFAPLFALLRRFGSLLCFWRRQKATLEHPTEHPPTDEHHAESPTEPLLDGMPSPWNETLSAVGLQPKSLTEAAVHVLRVDAGRYREQLAACETRARQTIAAEDAEACELLFRDVARDLAAWRTFLTDAGAAMKDRREPSERLELLRQGLQDSLELQTSLLEGATAALDAVDLRTDPTPAKRALHELLRLIDGIHVFRDRLLDSHALLARFENKLHELPPELQLDPQTALLSRVGFERTLVDWRSDNPRAKACRQLVMFDIDRFAKLNERLGTRAGDRLLSAIGHEFSRFVNHERGLDRVCRIAGERFLFLLGDITAAQALGAAEQLRQSVEALTITCDGNTVEFTVSCSVIESKADETSEHALGRLMAALNEARKAGRNRTAVDEGAGPQVVTDPERFPVKAKMITAPDA